MPENPFDNDWRDCLREQYRYVIRNQDTKTEKTLKIVLQEVGFSEVELNELRVLATMRDMPSDFVPEMDILKPAETTIHPVVMPEPAPQSEVAVEPPSDDELLMDESPDFPEDLVINDEVLKETPLEAESPPEDDDTPKQLSLF